MVTQATTSKFLPAIPPQPQPQPRIEPRVAMAPRPLRAAAGRSLCPRCHDPLVKGFEEPECLRCGYVDYTYTEPARAGRPTNLVSAGARYVVRYVGESKRLIHTLAHVQAVRLRNKAVYEVTCPFCSTTMEQSSLSGKRRDVREERFKCSQGHRVSITQGANFSLGWK